MPDRDDHRHRDYENRVPTGEAERIAIAAAKLASNDCMNEFFADLGISRGNVESMERFRNDLAFLRSLRQRKEVWQDLDFLAAMRGGSVKAAARVGLTILTLLTGAFAYGMVSWLKSVFSGGAPHP